MSNPPSVSLQHLELRFGLHLLAALAPSPALSWALCGWVRLREGSTSSAAFWGRRLG